MAGGEDFRLFKFDYETGKELGNFIDNVIYIATKLKWYNFWYKGNTLDGLCVMEHSHIGYYISARNINLSFFV